MVDKTISVRFEAVTAQYQAAMAKAAAATDNLGRKIKGVDVDKLGTSMIRTGGAMTAGLTLPLVALGHAAVGAAGELDAAFVKMTSLTNVAASEVAGLKDEVLGLSTETGQAPKVLADALFLIRSAGLQGQSAIDALNVSARAAAAGLGDASTVADAVTSAMLAYGPAALTAANATDVLVATAKEGKVEAAALAPQFGRLLPVAAELGITFEDVGAGLAFLSKSSGSAELSATQLGGVMNKLLKPSQQGAEALENVGLSADKIRQSIAERGLLPTLSMLRDRLGDSGFTQFFDDIQGLQGALNLTGRQADEARAVFDALHDSTGALDNAFGEWAESMGADNARSFAEFQVALIELGDKLAPLAADAASFAATIVGAFSALPEPAQAALVAVGGILAVAGPLATAGGVLLKSWGKIGPLLETGAIKALYAKDSLKTLGGVAKGLSFAGAAAGLFLLGNMLDDARKKSQRFALEVAGGGDDVGKKIANVKAEIEELQHVAGRGVRFDGIPGISIFANNDAKKAQNDIDALNSVLADLELQQKLTGDATRDAASEISAEEQAVQETTDAFQELSDALAAQFDPLFGAQDAMLNLRDAQEAAAAAAAEFGAESAEAAQANREVARAALENEQAQLDLRASIEAGDTSMEEARDTLARWTEDGSITQAQADQLGKEFDDLAAGAKALPERVSIDIVANTTAYEAAIRDITQRANPQVRISVGGGGGFKVATGGVFSYASGGITPAHIATGDVIRYAEPETGGEAFIPRNGSRDRALGILGIAAGWYGAGITDGDASQMYLDAAPGPVGPGASEVDTTREFILIGDDGCR